MVKISASKHDSGSRKLLYLLAMLIFFVILAGCGAGPIWTREDPEDVLTGFLQATEGQSPETMWEFLSSETRRKLEERASSFNATSTNGETRRGYDMLRAGHVLSSTREYKKIELASLDGEKAIVNIVMHDGSNIPVALHREDGRWAIDLPL